MTNLKEIGSSFNSNNTNNVIEFVNNPPNISLEFQDDDEIEHSKKEKDKIYIELNRFIHSKKCIMFYIFIITISLLLFCYSLYAYFFEKGK